MKTLRNIAPKKQATGESLAQKLTRLPQRIQDKPLPLAYTFAALSFLTFSAAIGSLVLASLENEGVLLYESRLLMALLGTENPPGVMSGIYAGLGMLNAVFALALYQKVVADELQEQYQKWRRDNRDRLKELERRVGK